MKIRYLWRIRALEYVVKWLGLWERYCAALGFGRPTPSVPVKRQVILGVPFRRRVRAAWCALTGCQCKHGITVIHQGTTYDR